MLAIETLDYRRAYLPCWLSYNNTNSSQVLLQYVHIIAVRIATTPKTTIAVRVATKAVCTRHQVAVKSCNKSSQHHGELQQQQSVPGAGR